MRTDSRTIHTVGIIMPKDDYIARSAMYFVFLEN